jgi:hypothetical protein
LEFLIVIVLVVHLILGLQLLGRLLEVDGLASCPTTSRNDVFFRDGFEIVVVIIVIICRMVRLA